MYHYATVAVGRYCTKFKLYFIFMHILMIIVIF